ncbi:alpha/beta fold hydrolase [Nitrospirillum iridis]|uniref:Pimeloyl-ACP methyl ester carboxylesterase n=1 Tax=Nitrospirillum iridis TaxID=765888 RepID=A0A7X0B0C7_9PROT|nr:alpha/beta hydrolase [Nitrospirillum iridis]MBB6253340.1 pimeloyl-ACP methyl ester carboxylesterase [Nitrospirillum iridis]
MGGSERSTFRGLGVDLAADVAGPTSGTPVLFLHGSGQTRRSWGKALNEGARRGFRAVALDLRGHGDSQWSPDGRYDLGLFADDLAAVLEQFPAPPIVVGASLGGLAGMLTAAATPRLVRALVLVDITARIEFDGTKEVMDFMGSGLNGFATLDEAADAVAAYLPHRERPKDTRGIARNLGLRDGRYYWHWDPAFMQMGKDAAQRRGAPDRLVAAARALTVPTLLLRGGRSRIVSDAGAREFLEHVPHAEHVDIADAHHMIAGDANDAFNQAVFDFVSRH